ncbi:hypothetical protein [Trinickia sp.]|uniref:hypothetical protein n=1 Tax=Trinickia sp. TaxID=2571163 RepID=UPI003F80E775
MTWIADQSPEELRAFMCKREAQWIASMTDALALRLWTEVKAQDERIAQLEKELATARGARSEAA